MGGDYDVSAYFRSVRRLLRRPPTPSRIRLARMRTEGSVKITVPDDQKSISMAMRCARSGDTILIKPGTYHDSVVLKSGVRILGLDRRWCVVERSEGAPAAFLAAGCRDVSIEGLTVRPGKRDDQRVWSLCVGLAAKDGKLIVGSLSPASALYRGGVRRGDEIVSVNGWSFTNGVFLPYFVALRHPSQETVFSVRASGRRRLLKALPETGTLSDGPYGLLVANSTIGVSNCVLEGFREASIAVVGSRSKLTVRSSKLGGDSKAIKKYTSGATVAVGNVGSESKAPTSKPGRKRRRLPATAPAATAPAATMPAVRGNPKPKRGPAGSATP